MYLEQVILLKVKSEPVTPLITTFQLPFLLTQTKSLLPKTHDLISAGLPSPSW